MNHRLGIPKTIPMHPEVSAILHRVKQTADLGYVDFTDINCPNELGDNALHCVIVWGDYEAAKTLVAHGININQRGDEGYTPLHQACAFGHKNIARLLLENGADLSSRTEGNLPFTTARLSGHDEICELVSQFAKQRGHSQVRPHDRHLEALANSIRDLEKMIDEHCKPTL